MSPKIRFCVMTGYAILAPVCLAYAWLFERLLSPSFPLIPICGALLALGSAGAAGYQLAAIFAILERHDA